MQTRFEWSSAASHQSRHRRSTSPRPAAEGLSAMFVSAVTTHTYQYDDTTIFHKRAAERQKLLLSCRIVRTCAVCSVADKAFANAGTAAPSSPTAASNPNLASVADSFEPSRGKSQALCNAEMSSASVRVACGSLVKHRSRLLRTELKRGSPTNSPSKSRGKVHYLVVPGPGVHEARPGQSPEC